MSKIIGVDGRALETDEEKAKRVEARKQFEAKVEFAIMLEAAGLLMGVAKVPDRLHASGMSLDQYRNQVAQSLIKIVGQEAFEGRFKVKLLFDDEPKGVERSNDVTGVELPPIPGRVVTGMFPKSKRVH